MTPATSDSIPHPPPGPPPREPLAFGEWWDDLLWPRVLTGAGMGLRPNRIGIAFFAVVIAAVLLGVGGWLDGVGKTGEPVRAEAPPAAVSGGTASNISTIRAEPAPAPGKLTTVAAPFLTLRPVTYLPWRWFVSGPVTLLRTLPWTTVVMGPLLLIVLTISLGAIARMTAVDVAHGRRMPWSEGLGFAAARWRSLLGAVLAPLVVIWGAVLIGALFGAVLLRWPLLNIVGGLLFVIPLALSMMAALAAGGFILGAPMLAPAVVCEGTDAIDALQRAFAYVTARLPRLLLYLVLSTLGVVFATAVVWTVVSWGIGLAAQSAALWIGVEGREELWHAVPPVYPVLAHPDVPSGTYAAASGLIRFWMAIPLAVALATGLSCAGSAATVLYLAMRRVCDGQDMAEVWTPGAVEAGMREAMAGRAMVGGTAGSAGEPLGADADA